MADRKSDANEGPSLAENGVKGAEKANGRLRTNRTDAQLDRQEVSVRIVAERGTKEQEKEMRRKRREERGSNWAGRRMMGPRMRPVQENSSRMAIGCI